MADNIVVELKDLHFFVPQGLFEEEQWVENELKIEVALQYTAPQQVIRHITDTINYATVYQLVKEVVRTNHLLLETTAMLIAQQIAHTFPIVEEITIAIQKVNPPIVNFIGSVGIRYTKRFK